MEPSGEVGALVLNRLGGVLVPDPKGAAAAPAKWPPASGGIGDIDGPRGGGGCDDRSTTGPEST